MLSLFESAICLFFIGVMFPSFQLFCLNSLEMIVTYFFPRLKNDD